MPWGGTSSSAFWSTHCKTLRSPRGLSRMERPSASRASLPAARITALRSDMLFLLGIRGEPQPVYLANTIAGHLHRDARERPVPGSLALGSLDQDLVPSAPERHLGGRPVEVVFVHKRGFAGVGECARLLPVRRRDFPIVDPNLGARRAPLALAWIRRVAAGSRRSIEANPKAHRFGARRPHVGQGVSRALTHLGQPAVVLPVIHGDGGAHRVRPLVGLAV